MGEQRDQVWIDAALLLPGALLVAAALLAPNLIEARRWSNERAAIGALKTINTSQTLFRESGNKNGGVLAYGTLDDLSNTTLIDAVLGSGTKQGYRFEVRPSPTTPEFLWFATASPVDPFSDQRIFCTNDAGVIFYTTTAARCWLTVEEGGDDCAIPAGLLPLGR